MPVPVLTREPPLPLMMPATSVEPSLPPTVSCFAPSWYDPAPSIEPAVIPAEMSCEMLNTPFALVMKRALPPVLLPLNSVVVPASVVMVALPALLKLSKRRMPSIWLIILALPAVLWSENRRSSLLVMLALPAVALSSKSRDPKLVTRVALPAVVLFTNWTSPPLVTIEMLPPSTSMPVPVKVIILSCVVV